MPAPPSIHEYVIEQLQLCKGTWPAVAKETGMSIRTIRKIGNRDWENPGVSYVEELADYFRSRKPHRRHNGEPRQARARS